MNRTLRLWVALSPHGYGHAGMTAPVVAELRRRFADVQLTLQTTLPDDFLRSRFGQYHKIPVIHDFGFRMVSASQVDVQASVAAYTGLVDRLDDVIATEAELMCSVRPDLVLANVPFVTIAAARRAQIPVVGFSSLNWADLYREIIPQTPETAVVLSRILDCYGAADCFLQTTPAQPMTLPKIRRVGPVGSRGTASPAVIRQRLQIDPSQKIGLIAFGGMDRGLCLDDWPSVPGWFWLLSKESQGKRSDMVNWEAAGLGFSDLLASVDVVVTKSGYGTFVEAALSGTPVLYEPRPHWPEASELEQWLHNNTRSCALTLEQMLSPTLGDALAEVLSQPYRRLDNATGIVEAADIIESFLQ